MRGTWKIMDHPRVLGLLGVSFEEYDVIKKRALFLELIFVVDEGRVYGVRAVVTVKIFM